jgi:hypothetical protein
MLVLVAVIIVVLVAVIIVVLVAVVLVEVVAVAVLWELSGGRSRIEGASQEDEQAAARMTRVSKAVVAIAWLVKMTVLSNTIQTCRSSYRRYYRARGGGMIVRWWQWHYRCSSVVVYDSPMVAVALQVQ